jgi:hypothetical protein
MIFKSLTERNLTMTQKEILIIKAIWGSDSRNLKKDTIKKDIIRNIHKTFNWQKNSSQT